LPSNSPHGHMVLRCGLVGAHTGGGIALAFKQPTWPYDIERGPGGLTREVESPLASNSPHGHMVLREDLVGSHGRWNRPCLQTSPNTTCHNNLNISVLLHRYMRGVRCMTHEGCTVSRNDRWWWRRTSRRRPLRWRGWCTWWMRVSLRRRVTTRTRAFRRSWWRRPRRPTPFSAPVVQAACGRATGEFPL
jgi:hypothetical protein